MSRSNDESYTDDEWYTDLGPVVSTYTSVERSLYPVSAHPFYMQGFA